MHMLIINELMIVNDWMNDEIEWMDVWMNEGMKKIWENRVSACSGVLHKHNVS